MCSAFLKGMLSSGRHPVRSLLNLSTAPDKCKVKIRDEQGSMKRHPGHEVRPHGRSRRCRVEDIYTESSAKDLENGHFAS